MVGKNEYGICLRLLSKKYTWFLFEHFFNLNSIQINQDFPEIQLAIDKYNSLENNRYINVKSNTTRNCCVLGSPKSKSLSGTGTLRNVYGASVSFYTSGWRFFSCYIEP